MPENFETKSRLRSFMEEIKELRRQEEAGEVSTAHLKKPEYMKDEEYHFEPEELTEADMEIWDKLRGEDITIEEFREYMDGVVAEEMAAGRDWKTSSRLIFAELAANRANTIVNKHVINELNEYKK